MPVRKIAIIGGGSLGSALAVNLSKKQRIHLVIRNPDDAAELSRSRRHPRYLPDAYLPEEVVVSTELPAALANADLALIATPVSAFGEVIRRIAAVRRNLPVIWGCKGFSPETGELLSQIAAAVLGRGACFGALSGPSFADGLAAGNPTALVVATNRRREITLGIAEALSNSSLRVYASDDLIGVQVCGAIKNVYAIAAGMIDGCGWGENTRAAMMTRAVSEVERFLALFRARKSTLMGLSGFGDIYLTCGSRHSRNYQVGLELAKGLSIDRILADLGHVAEGVHTVRMIRRKVGLHPVEMPIVSAVSDVLEGIKTPLDCAAALMARGIGYESGPRPAASRKPLDSTTEASTPPPASGA